MMMAFLHRPPNLDYLQVTPEWVEGLEEETAHAFLKKLEEHRERTVQARRRSR